ncbi:MAG TPA: hypothetical protein VFJ29_05145 [Candidatus Kapabacteria bacterium]|nr:hypothetical protein [Candidatus Kapabacteria bacterium]
MKRSYTIMMIAALSCAALYVACTSNSNNPTSNNNTGGASFTFKVGSSFVFDQWMLDTITGAKIPNSLKAVHEKVAAVLNSYQGMSNVYQVFDTTFTDSTATTVASTDTLYYATSGSVVYQYGFITQVFSILLGPYVPMPPKWDIIANAGNANWVVDTTATTPFGLLPLQLVLDGKDAGNVNFSAAPNALQSDNTSGSGSIVLTDSGKMYVIPISGNAYVSYSPAIVVKNYIASVLSTPNLGPVNGYERDLVSFSAN